MSRRRPNILFFFTDDQRFDTIRALGNSRIITPHLDALVAGGLTFTHAHIPGGTCGAVCMPSRAMLHTGRTLFRLQDSGSQIPAEHVTLGATLQAAGYHTIGCGKWHNERAGFNASFSDGDEILMGGQDDHWNVPVYHFDPTGLYEGRLPILDRVGHYVYAEQTRWRHGDHVNVGVHSSDMLGNAGVRYVEQYAGCDKPFFLYLSFLAPHDPRCMPRQYLDMYDGVEIPLPPNYMAGHPFDNGELFVRDEKLAGFPRRPEEIQGHIREYCAMITHLDAQLGRVLDALKRSGQYENTIIIFSGDNGLAVGQHGLMGKQSCYEHSVRVPLIFAGPGIPRDARTDALVYLLDIFPTLCALLDLPVPETVDGQSFADVVREPAGRQARDALYLAYRDCMRGVKDRQHKLVEYVVEGQHTMSQLFDLENDPWERRNLAGRRDTAQIEQRLRKELLRFRTAWEDEQTELGRTFWTAFDAQPSATLLGQFRE